MGLIAGGLGGLIKDHKQDWWKARQNSKAQNVSEMLDFTTLLQNSDSHFKCSVIELLKNCDLNRTSREL